jgi:methionyl-tRNA formyltransferase
MNIALLGSGDEWHAAAESVLAAGHVITHVGPIVDDSPADLRQRAAVLGAQPVRDHHEAVARGASTILLVSYGALIEPATLTQARFLNVHYALLPRFRGYHGLVWSIINGESQVGFTLHAVDERIDHGPIHLQCAVPLLETDTILDARANITQALRTQLGTALSRVDAGQAPQPQNDAEATIVARRRPDDGRVEWAWPAVRVHNLVRALTPPLYPGAFTTWRAKPLVIRRATRLPNPPFIGTPGRVVDFVGEAAWVMCGDRLLQLDDVEFEGHVGSPRALFTRVGGRLGAR